MAFIMAYSQAEGRLKSNVGRPLLVCLQQTAQIVMWLLQSFVGMNTVFLFRHHECQNDLCHVQLSTWGECSVPIQPLASQCQLPYAPETTK